MSLWEHALPASGTSNKALWAALFPQLDRIQSGKHFASIPVPAHCFWTDTVLGTGTQLCPLKTRDLAQARHLWTLYKEGKEEAPLGTSSRTSCRQLLPQLLTSLVCRLSLSPAHWHAPHISAPFLTWAPCITLRPHPGLAQNTEWDAKTVPFGWKKYSG